MTAYARKGFAALLLAAAGCAEVAPVPKPEDVGGDAVRLAELQAGRRLYVGRCSGCHGLFPVTWYPDAVWKEQVREMVRTRKVRLESGERDHLVRYLAAYNGQD